MKLDGDTPLALQLVRVEHLLSHLPVVQGPGEFQEAIRERGLPVVDVGDDAKIPNAIYAHEFSLDESIRLEPRNGNGALSGINRRPASGAGGAVACRAWRAVGAILMLTATACDLPSEAPSWDTRWIVRADSTRIGVGELLPDRISLNDAGDLFSVQVDPTTLSWTLLDLCPPCAGLDGQTVPKPPSRGPSPRAPISRPMW